MSDHSELKSILEKVAAEDYAVPNGLDAFALAQTMLQHVGDPDPVLRDDLIYTTLARWIMRDMFNSAEMREILFTILDDRHLTYCLGESGTDSVFTRSFSALLLPPLIIVHRRAPYLSAAEIHHILDHLLAYLTAEQDRRGFVRERGWAHSVAHTADGLDDLAQCDELGVEDLQAIMVGIAGAATTDLAPYVHEEDERLAYATLAVLRRDLVQPGWLVSWVRDFIPPALDRTPFPERHYRFLNIRNYLRSLYFQARKGNVDPDLQSEILDVLEKISHF